MATIKPFAALRPKPDLAAHICELPYDVMSSDEARAIAAGNPLSFLHISKPEIDLPPGTDLYAPEVYARGKENFSRLQAEGALGQNPQACFYLYRQVMGKHSQTGLVAVASCEEYLQGIIKKHELTRPDKEDDRVRHIETLNAQTGPVFLTYRAVAEVREFIAKKVVELPDIDFTAKDGVRHSSWAIRDRAGVRFVEAEFARVPSLYIADGHHRCAAAARIYLERSKRNPHPASDDPLLRKYPLSTAARRGEGRGEGASENLTLPVKQGSSGLPSDGRGTGGEGYAWVLAVIFPHDQVQILPYHRVLKDLNGLTSEELLQKLDGVFVLNRHGKARPTRRHELGLYLQGQWHTLNFRPSRLGGTAVTDPLEKLDVTLLQKHVLAPLMGIDDPRTSQRISFAGGIRGTNELERLVNSGDYACAFSMFPTGIEELMAIADGGGIMPPKSTWFEPKLRDGMFCHRI